MSGPKLKRLTGHVARSQAGVSGRGAIVFGLIFVAVGAGIVLVAADVIHSPDSSFGAPCWVVGSVGGLFGLAGLAVVGSGVRSTMRMRRNAQAAALHPDEPWLADHAWDSNGIRDEGNRTLRGPLAGAMFFTVFLIPFNWVGLKADMGFKRWPWMLIVGIFDLVTVLLWGSAVREVIRKQKYGKSYLQFDRFPFMLGHGLDVAFSAPKGIGAFDKMSFTLRCVQERYVTSGSGDDRRTSTYCYELYKDDIKMDQRGIFEGGHSQVPLHFDLPDDPELASELSARPPRYWELEVTADTPGIDFKATFLLPVYSGSDETRRTSSPSGREPVWSS